ncbi:MAG: hypothetical protein AAF456_00445 [Planctomycetota bacterium]
MHYQRQLSDNARRTICRLAFLLTCALPTCMTAYWIFHPQTAASWQQSIQAELAVETSVVSVECKGPYETILRGVEFRDPELGSLLKATQVRVIQGETRLIHVESPVSISSRALVHLIDRFRESIVRSHTADQPWQVAFGKTTITAEIPDLEYQPSVVATGIVIDVVPYDDATAVTARLYLENDLTGSPVQCYFHQGAGELQERSEFGIETGSNFLPAWLVNDLVPDVRGLGAACEFTGKIDVRPKPDGSVGAEIAGFFRSIDLGQIVAPYGQSLSGICDFHIHRCEIVDSQVHSMSAHAMCKTGTIGIQTLVSAVQHLGLTVPLRPEETEIAFSGLNLICEIEQGRLSLSGPQAGVIAYTQTGSDTTGNALLVSNGAPPKNMLDFANFLVCPDDIEPKIYDQRLVAVLSHFYVPEPRFASGGIDVPQLR